jgi:hypothetical protein
MIFFPRWHVSEKAFLGRFRAVQNAGSQMGKGSWIAHLKINAVEVRSSDLDARLFRKRCALFALPLPVFHCLCGLRCHPLTCMLLKIRLNVNSSPT